MRYVYILLFFVFSFSVGQTKEVCCHEYQTQFRGHLPMAFSIDPEVRGNMINESLAYTSGETADILRVLLLVRESDPALKKDLMIQISSSSNEELICNELAEMAKLDSENMGHLAGYVKFIKECNEKISISDEDMVGQPTAYCGPMNSFHLGDLSDKSKRAELYQEMKKYNESARIYLSALFLSIETDSKLILELKEMRKQTGEGYYFTGESVQAEAMSGSGLKIQD